MEREAAPETRGAVIRWGVSLYDFLAPLMILWQDERANRLVASNPAISAGARVLDMGCATGRLTRLVARQLDAARGGKAVGVDASPEMIAYARRKSKNKLCSFDLAAAESLPYPVSSFDVAVSSLFFHHLIQPDKERALQEAFRVLKPGGTLVVADLDKPEGLFGRFFLGTATWFFHQSAIAENAHGLLPTLFTKAGFLNVQLEKRLPGCIAVYAMRKPR